MNVYERTQRRLKTVFDLFDNIYVSFSGGKDSGVLLNLCIDYVRRHGLRPADACREEQKGRKKKTLCRGGFQQVSHFQQYSIYRPLRAMRHARLLYSPISGARQLRGRALRTRTLRSVRR